MKNLSQESCSVANRVSLSMIFAEASGQRVQAQVLVDEAFEITAQLLYDINPIELRDWFEQFSAVYKSLQSTLVDDPLTWSRFLAKTCDRLHRVGLHQKTIAVVGDELARWDRQPISLDEYGSSLDGLAALVTDYSQVLGNAIERQAGSESVRKRRALVYSHSVCGIMIFLVAINEAIEQGDPRSTDCAAMAIFGANLTRISVDRLYEVCELSRV